MVCCTTVVVCVCTFGLGGAAEVVAVVVASDALTVGVESDLAATMSAIATAAMAKMAATATHGQSERSFT